MVFLNVIFQLQQQSNVLLQRSQSRVWGSINLIHIIKPLHINFTFYSVSGFFVLQLVFVRHRRRLFTILDF